MYWKENLLYQADCETYRDVRSTVNERFLDTDFPRRYPGSLLILLSNKRQVQSRGLPRSSFTSHFSFRYHLRGNLFSVKELNRRVEHGREHSH